MLWYILVYKQKTTRNTSRVFFGSAVEYRVAPSQPKETEPSRYILDALLSNCQQGELMYCSTVFSMQRRVILESLLVRGKKVNSHSWSSLFLPQFQNHEQKHNDSFQNKTDSKPLPTPGCVFSFRKNNNETNIHKQRTSHELLYEPLVYLNRPTL